MKTFSMAGAVGLAIMGAATPVLAQDPPEVQAQRRALNEAQAQVAATDEAAYQAQKNAIAQDQAAKEAAYQQALMERDAKIKATEDKASADLAAWEVAVAECRAGDRTKCAPVVK